MCGICGEITFKGTVNRSAIESMKQSLLTRGPDSEGTHILNPIGFGHRRLSIIDLSDGGAQPMVDGDWALVFNGCIYNYRALRKKLQQCGAVFHSDSDTEVILRAWQTWGKDCLKDLDGMFAFALWHPLERKLYLCRDRFGIKPLYYTSGPNQLRFASTLPALLSVGDVDKTIDKKALQFLFSLHAVVPAPNTIYQNIKKLAPATVLEIDEQGNQHQHNYWQLSTEIQGDETLWQPEIEEALRQAVEKRLLASDVPVGVLLSGGLDSSLIVALVEETRQKMIKQQGDAPDLLTFSIGFDDVGSEKGSEFYYSDQVVQQFKTKHQKLHIENSAVLKRLPEAINAMSEPMFGQDAVAFFLLSEQVSQHVKVVLSGQGADEVFGGYFWYPQMQAHQMKYPHHSAAEQFSPYYLDRPYSEMAQMLNPEWLIEDCVTPWLNQSLSGSGDFTNRVLGLDVTTLIVDDPVKRVDNMTMAYSLEARVPFLDTHLVETASRTAAAWRLQNGGKNPLKTMSTRYFSDEFIYRTKGYFPMPALKHIHGEFYAWMTDLLNSEACRSRGLYNRDYVNTLLSNPEHPDHYTRLQGSKLWHLTLLEAWLQSH